MTLKRIWRKLMFWRRVNKAWHVWDYLIRKSCDCAPEDCTSYLAASIYMGDVVGELLDEYRGI